MSRYYEAFDGKRGQPKKHIRGIGTPMHSGSLAITGRGRGHIQRCASGYDESNIGLVERFVDMVLDPYIGDMKKNAKATRSALDKAWDGSDEDVLNFIKSRQALANSIQIAGPRMAEDACKAVIQLFALQSKAISQILECLEKWQKRKEDLEEALDILGNDPEHAKEFLDKKRIDVGKWGVNELLNVAGLNKKDERLRIQLKEATENWKKYKSMYDKGDKLLRDLGHIRRVLIHGERGAKDLEDTMNMT